MQGLQLMIGVFLSLSLGTAHALQASPTTRYVASRRCRAAIPAASDLVCEVAKCFKVEGIAFFNAMRTPAALVAAAAINDASVLTRVEDDIKNSRSMMALRNAYLMLNLIAFGVETLCIFVSTHAIMRLQMRPPSTTMACSLVALLRGPGFEFEYVSVRASFMSGLLSFAAAQALRARVSLRESKELADGAMWLLLSIVAMLLVYNNSMSITYGGFGGLLGKWLCMSWALAISRLNFRHPIAVSGVIMTALGFRSLLRQLWLSTRGPTQTWPRR
jgi:hypothetical protein